MTERSERQPVEPATAAGTQRPGSASGQVMHDDRAPGGADHETHERLLMVQLAAGDLTAEERPRAEALRSACAECASIESDVRAIARATAALPAPHRSRDFRITPEQAGAARGSVVRRFLERLSAPRFGALQPLGAAVMGIGLVLVVVGLGMPGMGGASTGGAGIDVYTAREETRSPATDAPAVNVPVVDPGDAEPGALATDDTPAAPAAPAVTTAPVAPELAGESPRRGSQGVAVPGSGAEADPDAVDGRGTPTPAAPAAGDPGSGVQPTPAEPTTAAEVDVSGPDESMVPVVTRVDAPADGGSSGAADGTLPQGSALVTLGLLLAVLGLVVLTLRVISLRTRRDPTLR